MNPSMSSNISSGALRSANIDITPMHFPVTMAGFGPGFAAARPDGALEMNALMLGEGGSALLLVSIDALFACDQLKGWFMAELGLDACQINIFASHTHYAPTVDVTKPRLGAMNEDYQGQLRCAVRRLSAQLAGLEPQQFNERNGSSRTSAGVYRRIAWPVPHIGGRSRWIVPPGIENAPNFDVELPNILRCALLETVCSDRSPSKPLAVVWTLACHPTRYHSAKATSADFVGVVRERLRRLYGLHLPVLFLQGFSGDVNPRPAKRPTKWTARNLLFGPRAKPFSREEWLVWSQSIADKAIEALDNCEGSAPAEQVELTEASIALSNLIESPMERRVSASRVKIGRIDIMSISAEVVSHYEFGLPSGVWPIGCANSVFGYWPSNQQVVEGGYEGGGYFRGFGLEGRFRDDVEEPFSQLMRDLGIEFKTY